MQAQKPIEDGEITQLLVRFAQLCCLCRDRTYRVTGLVYLSEVPEN